MKTIEIENPCTGEVVDVWYLWADKKRVGYGQWSVELTFEYKNSRKIVSFWTNDEDFILEMNDESAFEKYGDKSMDSVIEWVFQD